MQDGWLYSHKESGQPGTVDEGGKREDWGKAGFIFFS